VIAYLSLASRVALVVVCVAAMLGKVRSRTTFRAFVTSVEQVARAVPMIRAPSRFAAAVAVPAVATEFAVAAALAWPATGPAGTVLAVALFGALTAFVWFAVVTGSEARCACFGKLSHRLSWPHVARNATLTAAAVATWWPAGGLPVPGVLVSIVAGVVVAAVVLRWEDLAVLFGSGVEVRS
jgi:hypothetical protein